MIIVLCALVLLAIRIAYSCAEIWFEKDFPRNTWKGLALSIVLVTFCISVFM